MTRITGCKLVRQAIPEWLWKGRHVKLFDGSTVSMPDTPANQAAYPQQANQKPGVGFPLARIGVLFWLSVGWVLGLGLRRWAGGFQSELANLRDMWESFDAGDVLVTDRYLCSQMENAVLQSLGGDVVGRMHAQRKLDFRRSKQIALEDHLVSWKKPSPPDWMSNQQYAALPDEMRMRELCYRLPADGFRPTTIVLASTLLEAEQDPWDDVADLYGQRGADRAGLPQPQEPAQGAADPSSDRRPRAGRHPDLPAGVLSAVASRAGVGTAAIRGRRQRDEPRTSCRCTASRP